MATLKHCPFCSRLALLQMEGDRAYVECVHCGARTKLFGYDDIKQEQAKAWAVRAWNMRSDDYERV